jgi:hypothetical protein
MPKKKRKSSSGRLTANAKNMQKTRLNEDEKTYSQRLEINKEKHVIGRKKENVGVSRVGSQKNLKIYAQENKTINIVYQEILHD